MRFGYGAIDGYVTALRITWTYAYACWLLRFQPQVRRHEVGWGGRHFFSWSDPILITWFPKTRSFTKTQLSHYTI